MATGVVFLQSSLEQGESKPSAYKAGNTEVIRSMLREQQKDCQRLHANSLFKEFRDEGNKQKKFGKGYAAPVDSQPLVIDFQAEGQSRMFELIKSRATRDEKPLHGVWASFGKPYVCLGAPQEPKSGLPPLNRDTMLDGKGGNARRARKLAQAQAQGSELRPQSVRRRLSSSASSRDGGGTTAGTMDLSPAELEEMKLVRAKTLMKFGPNDLTEVKFPEGPLRNAAARLTKSKVRVGSYADADSAAGEAGDPEAAYGQPPLPVRHLSPVHGHNGAACEDTRSNVFVTQQGVGEDPDSGMMAAVGLRRVSYAGARTSQSGTSPAPRDDDASESAAGVACSSSPDAGAAGAGAPHFQPLVAPAVPERGQEDNPVYKWHNQFVDVRQRGREALTQALYERSAGRFKARSFAKMGTNLAGLLMADLEGVKGRKAPHVSATTPPENPYAKMEEAWAEAEESRKVRSFSLLISVRSQRAHALDPEELRVMQRFYDQLCALVEAQHMSDPLCLMVVHKVRAALEGGASLNKTLLVAIIDHIAEFTRGCGLLRHNKYSLSVLTFVAKVTGVSPGEFESLVTSAGICMVVYGQDTPPAREPEPPTPGRGGLSRKASMMRSSMSLRRGGSSVLRSQVSQQASVRRAEELDAAIDAAVSAASSARTPRKTADSSPSAAAAPAPAPADPQSIASPQELAQVPE